MADVVDKIIESFSGWDGDQYESFILYDAKFRNDFGPFKKGETPKVIQFSFSEGVLGELDEHGKITRSCNVKLVVSDPNG